MLCISQKFSNFAVGMCTFDDKKQIKNKNKINIQKLCG